MHNWSREFCQWAPDVKVVTYDGTPDERRQIRAERMVPRNFNVLLTHYDLVIRDKNAFRKVRVNSLSILMVFLRSIGNT